MTAKKAEKSEIDNERAALRAELEQVKAKAADTEKELTAIRSRGKNAGTQINTTFLSQADIQRSSDLQRAFSDLTNRVQSIRERREQLDKIEAYQRKVAESDATAKAAREASTAAEKQCAELTARGAKLRQRIDALQAENCAAEERAFTAESDAARTYAKAVSSGVDKAEKEALDQVQEAQAAMASVRAKVADCSGVIAALASEAESLEQQAEAAKSEADDQRAQMFEAQVTRLRADWDGAVSKLMSIGAKLIAVSYRARLTTGLHYLHLPVFAEGEPDYFIESSLVKLAESVDPSTI